MTKTITKTMTITINTANHSTKHINIYNIVVLS